MQLAIFGLGRMGMQIAKRLHKNNFEVLAWNRSAPPRQEFAEAGGKVFTGIEETAAALTSEPRIFWVMLPNNVVEDFIFSETDGLIKYLKAGDIVIDGGSSYGQKECRRAAR